MSALLKLLLRFLTLAGPCLEAGRALAVAIGKMLAKAKAKAKAKRKARK